MVTTCLIFNPAARGGKAKNLKSHLGDLASICRLLPTTGPGDARKLAAQAVAEGFLTIIAAGGDGTVNEVVNGIGDVPGGFERARLGVLPIGTINVFARELGMPSRFRDCFEILKRGREELIDLPVAEFGADGKSERRFFVQLGGAGIDSRAVELVSWELKKKTGPLAYVYAGFKAFLEPHPKITVQAGQTCAGDLVLFGNGRFYGGSFQFFPMAGLQNGVIDLCIFPKATLMQILMVGLGLLIAKPLRFSSAIHLQAQEFLLTSDIRACLELDGEFVGELPAKISVKPKRLRVIVP